MGTILAKAGYAATYRGDATLYARAQLNLGIAYGSSYGVPEDDVQAHMWLNLASSRFAASEKEGREEAIKIRDLIATKMTPAQIAEAQKLAREWKPKPAQ